MWSKKEWSKLMCMAGVVAPMVALPAAMVAAQANDCEVLLNDLAQSKEALAANLEDAQAQADYDAAIANLNSCSASLEVV